MANHPNRKVSRKPTVMALRDSRGFINGFHLDNKNCAHGYRVEFNMNILSAHGTRKDIEIALADVIALINRAAA